jgi:hypothetical protein
MQRVDLSAKESHARIHHTNSSRFAAPHRAPDTRPDARAGFQPVPRPARYRQLQSSALLAAGDLAVYDTSTQAIEFRAIGDAEFVLGSAVPHPHPLVLGSYSVHTSLEALRRGEEGIRREGARMRAAKAVAVA